MNDVAELVARLRLKDEMSGPLGKIRKNLGGFDSQMKGIGDRAYKAGQQVGTGIKRGAIIAAGAIGLLTTQVLAGLQSLAQLETATAQTNAVIKSTKGVAGQTAESIRALSEGFENLNATMDDKVIQSGANVLLTFTNIRKEAFEPTLEAALDLSTAMGQDLQTSIVQVGKALNDPIRGLTSLQRIGVSFTKQQRDQIKALNDSGDALGAQKIILAELNKEFGGSFAAAGKTTTGTIASIGDAVGDLQKTLSAGLLPVIQKILPKIRAALADPKVIATVQKLGDAIAELFNDQNLAEGGKVLGSLFDTAKAAAPVVKDAAVATLGAVKAAVSLFTSLPKEVQQLAIGAFAINKITGGLVTNLAGGLIGSVLKQLVSGVVNVNGAVVNVVGAGGVPGTPGGSGGSALRTAATAAAVVVTPIAAAVGAQAVLNAAIPNMAVAQNALERATARAEAERAAAARGDVQGPPTPAGQTPNYKGLISAITTAESKAATAQVKAIERAEAIASGKADQVRAASQRAATAIQRVEAAENRTARAVTAKLALVRSAAQAAAFAIRDKDLSVKIGPTNITVNTRVSLRETIKTQTTFRKLGGFVAS